MRYVINTTVVRLELKRQIMSSNMVKGEMISEVRDLGWFVLFDGSHESLFVGEEEPKDLAPGKKVTITIEPR